MVKDIIVEHILTNENVQDVILDIKLVRIAGLHLIWNTLTEEYDTMSVKEPLAQHYAVCTTGLLTNITDNNLEKLLSQINMSMIKKETLSRCPWSQRKPR